MTSSTGILKSGPASSGGSNSNSHIIPTIIITDNSGSSNGQSSTRPLTVSPSVQFSDQIVTTSDSDRGPEGGQGIVRAFWKFINAVFNPVRAPLNGCRKRTFKKVHSRPMLIAICGLVVVECVCVLSELMVDLQGIKLRFDNEAEEINKFVTYFRNKHPEAFETVEMKRMKDFMHLLKTSALHSSVDQVTHQMCQSINLGHGKYDRLSYRNRTNHTFSKDQTSKAPFLPSSLSSLDGSLNNNNDVINYTQGARTDLRANNISKNKHPTNQRSPRDFVNESKLQPGDILISSHEFTNYVSTSKSPHHDSSSSIAVSFITGGTTPAGLIVSNNNSVTSPHPAIRHTQKKQPTQAVPLHYSTNVFEFFTNKNNIITNNTTTITGPNVMIGNIPDVINKPKQPHSNETFEKQNSVMITTSKGKKDKNILEPISNNSSHNKKLVPSPTTPKIQSTFAETNLHSNSNAPQPSPNLVLNRKRRESTATKSNRAQGSSSLTNSLDNLFVLAINNVKENFFLMAELLPVHVKTNGSKHSKYKDEYKNIYRTSKALHYTSLSILGIMVLETAVKLFCTGCDFFKNKLEVFDAIIVISSFSLDVMFLDSRWYETGKDATALLVLLLPWRVVRIVNSFVMTIKHKHQIQLMNLKRGKKKAELKTAKVHALLGEIRKDVQLLVNLCKSVNVDESSINACLYGKGRNGGVTQTVMETCASIVLISTLGKNPKPQEDDIYGALIQEALEAGGTSFKSPQKQQEEEAAIDAAIALDDKIEARRKSSKRKSSLSIRLKKALLTRSHTIPRRCASLEIPGTEDGIEAQDDGGMGNNVFYIHEETGDIMPDGDYVIVDNDGHYYIRDVVIPPEDDGGSHDASHPYVNVASSEL